MRAEDDGRRLRPARHEVPADRGQCRSGCARSRRRSAGTDAVGRVLPGKVRQLVREHGFCFIGIQHCQSRQRQVRASGRAGAPASSDEVTKKPSRPTTTCSGRAAPCPAASASIIRQSAGASARGTLRQAAGLRSSLGRCGPSGGSHGGDDWSFEAISFGAGSQRRYYRGTSDVEASAVDTVCSTCKPARAERRNRRSWTRGSAIRVASTQCSPSGQ